MKDARVHRLAVMVGCVCMCLWRWTGGDVGKGDGIQQASWSDCTTFLRKERCSSARRGRKEGKGEGNERGREEAKGSVASVASWLTGRHFRTNSTILSSLHGTEAKYSQCSFGSRQGCIVFTATFAGFNIVRSPIICNPFTSHFSVIVSRS